MGKLDVLNREGFVDQLVQLTETISSRRASVSFAIDGVWGSGKSFVLDMLEERLMQFQSDKPDTDKYLIVRYNCWKYDYYEEPLIAIISTIIEAIDRKTKLLQGENGEKFKGVLRAIGTSLLSISSNALEVATGINIDGIYSVIKSGIESGKDKYDELQKFDGYFELRKTLKKLQNVLDEIGEQYKLVFLVDELDRCMPEYSIKALERLHHLTENSKNIISIMAIDKSQLQTSICHIFGFKDADEYLKKFIQFTVQLDLGKPSNKIVQKYSEYVALFDGSHFSIDEPIEEFWQAVFTDVDAREQEQLVDKVMLVHKLLYNEPKDYSFMSVELLFAIMHNRGDVFTNWLYKFGEKANGNVSLPLPLQLLEEKLISTPYETVIYPAERGAHEFKFSISDSIYPAIACIWSSIFLNEYITRFSVKNKEINALLKKNAEELQSFVDTFNLIN